jgi:hypothetical protein
MTATVCIPVWNGEAFVEETLESVRAQTLDDISVLVSVDRSEDRSADICRAFAARDPRFEAIVHSTRLGWIGNVNWLLRHLESEYVTVLPHDDVLAPSYLERLIAELETRPEAVLAFSDVQSFGTRELVRSGPSSTGDLFTRIVDFLYLSTTAIAWRGVFRSTVLEHGCYLDEVNGAAADQVWLLRLAIEGSLIRVPEVLYRKRLHEASVVANSMKNGMPIDSHWADHCVSCHRIALAADSWTLSQRQAIAAACMVRAMRLPDLTAMGSSPSEIAASVLALTTDYALRLSDLSPAGSSLMTSADVPDRLRNHLADRVGSLRAWLEPRSSTSAPVTRRGSAA